MSGREKQATPGEQGKGRETRSKSIDSKGEKEEKTREEEVKELSGPWKGYKEIFLKCEGTG